MGVQNLTELHNLIDVMFLDEYIFIQYNHKQTKTIIIRSYSFIFSIFEKCVCISFPKKKIMILQNYLKLHIKLL